MKLGGTRTRGNDLARQADLVAGQAVREIQTGGSPEWYMVRAAALRAEAYEFHATADLLRPLEEARWQAWLDDHPDTESARARDARRAAREA